MFTFAKKNNKKAESTSTVNLKRYLIPLEEITRATNNFSSHNLIGKGQSCMVYEGQLSERWQNRTAAIKRLSHYIYVGENQFLEEVELYSKFHHENIIPFIGYCNQGIVKVIVYEYATNGSLDGLLENTYKRRCITWSQRLNICLGAARGLNCLHSGFGDDNSVIHRDFKSTNILLDNNLEAKICDFGLSRPGATMHHFTIPETRTMGNLYLDPIYYEAGYFGKETDIYSYGLVLFEMLSGMLVSHERSVGVHGRPRNLINLVRSHYDHGLDKLIDPCIRAQIDTSSFQTFKEIAYRCISYKLEDRPTMAIIIKTIEKALDIQNHGAVSSAITRRSLRYRNLENFLIPLKEINLATRNFSKNNEIGDGGFFVIYRGKLSHHWQNSTVAIKRFGLNGYKGNDEFYNELEMISSFNHENIIPFIGYCVEGNEMVLVYKYAVNGSLDQYLHDPWKSRHITWEQRLSICLGAARGLNYLHAGRGEHKRVVHREVNSSNILLDDNFEAKICGFCWSILVPKDQSHTEVYTNVSKDRYITHTLYNDSQIPSTELDVYSFGVVLFEMLSGMLVFHEKSIGDDKPENLINLVRHHYDNGQDKLIDPHIKDHIDQHSFHKFIEIAYKCISVNLKDRPTMDRIIKRIEEALLFQEGYGAISTITVPTHQYQDLEKFIIPLEEIEVAIGVRKRIGDGGFGIVYKAQLSERWQNRIAAIKKHDPKGYQGKNEFRNEVEMLSRFHHQNIIPFIGYYDEGDHMIIVSEYATNGSLDYYLRDLEKRSSLKWIQRLEICLGAAKGLNYLHSGLGDDNRVIHRDIKSANILLDDNLEAKICDFGLSRSGPKNQPKTQIYTKAAGTNFYMDPIYRESGILRKESDVYSFGVVLFEMLSGMLAYYGRKIGTDKPETLISLVRRLYDEGLHKLIDPVMKDQLDPRSFDKFKEIAHDCISYNIKERPTMETVIERIEDALNYQVKSFIETNIRGHVLSHDKIK